MTKQKEVLEETEVLVRACLLEKGMDISIAHSLSGALMLLLNGLGVVIKVDRELPEPAQEFSIEQIQGYGFCQEDMAGYVAVEPLIEESNG